MLCAALALVALGLLAGPAAADWDTAAAAPPRTIEGYMSEVSAAPGETLHLHVGTTPAARYRVEFHRLGWYPGATPPLVGCLPACDGSSPGAARPMPAPAPGTGLIDAGWPVTDTYVVPASWSSGYYVARLVLASGPNAGRASLVPIVIRAPASRRSAILVKASVDTWQAYNSWGGKNLYPGGSTGGVPANRVSFNRPYSFFRTGGQSFFDFEIQLARFLERSGYDVSYTTNVDVARDPGSLLGHRLVVASGHDEYWSKAERDALEAARARPVNLAFMGSNIGYWQIRYEDGYRTIVGYKDAGPDPFPDASQKTVRFRSLTPPRPECTLLGVMSHGGLLHSPADYSLVAGALALPWMGGTGFTAGAAVPGVVGYEIDGVDPGCHVDGSTSTTLLHYFHFSNGGPSNADAVAYRSRSGAWVFSAGTFEFSWGLDGFGTNGAYVDARLQAFARNLFTGLAGPPGTTGPAPPAAKPAPKRCACVTVRRHGRSRCLTRLVEQRRHKGSKRKRTRRVIVCKQPKKHHRPAARKRR